MDLGQLWEQLARINEGLGAEIKMECSVKKLNIQDGKIKSITYIKQGKEEEIEGDIFISSMPLKDLINGLNGNDVPEKIRKIGNGLPYRDFITVRSFSKKTKT